MNLITVSFNGDVLAAKAEIDLKEKRDEFSFILNEKLAVKSIDVNGKKTKWKTESGVKPTFGYSSNKITITSKGMENLAVEYSGPIDGWCNKITEKIIALSMYSVWFPQQTSEEIDEFRVDLLGLQEYFVVKGSYIEEKEIWSYGGGGFAKCNIVAYKKSAYKTFSENGCNIYWVDKSEKAAALMMADYYKNIMEYYSKELFYPIKKEEYDVVSLSYDKPAGAYLRNGLIVCARFQFFDSDKLSVGSQMEYLFGHELAHNWCTGANIDSWEDWLNETTAEWGALAYALDKSKTDIFEYAMKRRLEKRDSMQKIKSDNGKRPADVHDNGTLIYYDIYNEHGLDVIKELLRIFVNLKEKNTATYLDEIRARHGEELAEFINIRLNKKNQ